MFNVFAKLTCNSSEATSELAERLGVLLQPGDVILLDGSIGSGKTHFARSAIQSLLTVAEDIPSPTYTLIQVYDTDKGQLWHADLYRLSDVSEVVELGLASAFEDSICFVEWPDRLGSMTPGNALTISFSVGEHEMARELTFASAQNAWPARLKELLNDRP